MTLPEPHRNNQCRDRGGEDYRERNGEEVHSLEVHSKALHSFIREHLNLLNMMFVLPGSPYLQIQVKARAKNVCTDQMWYINVSMF